MSGPEPRRGRGPRVVGGELGGRRLAAPHGMRTRPTTDRVKEALFAALGPDRVEGMSVLDVYAGSGSLAVEALSRGASRAVLVERDRRAAEVARANLSRMALAARARVVVRPIRSFLTSPPPPEGPFGLVFLDPPYEQAEQDLEPVLAGLARPGWVDADARVMMELRAATAPGHRGPAAAGWVPSGWGIAWERTYGDTLVRVVAPST